MKEKEWFEKSDFWEKFSPIMFDEAHWKEAPVVAEYAGKIAGLKKGDSVLDAGCGIGRISVELALLGFDVTGVDIIQSELDAAQESANAEDVKINFVNQDLRSFKSDKKFDLAVNLYNSFGYCDDINDDFKIIKSIYESLKTGGTFILECISRETAIMYFTEGEWFERAGFTVLTEFKPVGLWEYLRSHWILIDKNGKKIDHVFNQRLYSAVEYKNMMLNAGFSKCSIYGDFDFSPYDNNARTMILVAKK